VNDDGDSLRRSMSTMVLPPRLVSHDIAGTAPAVTEQSDLGATFFSASGAGVGCRWVCLAGTISQPRIQNLSE